jgi:hypothetical protein
LSAKNDLLNNVLEPQLTNNAITISVTATAPVAGSCNGSAISPLGTVLPASGLVAWGTTLHANTSQAPAVYQVTENPFVVKPLGIPESTRMTTLCMLNVANGSGAGICNSCKPGALGAAKQ